MPSILGKHLDCNRRGRDLTRYDGSFPEQFFQVEESPFTQNILHAGRIQESCSVC